MPVDKISTTTQAQQNVKNAIDGPKSPQLQTSRGHSLIPSPSTSRTTSPAAPSSSSSRASKRKDALSPTRQSQAAALTPSAAALNRALRAANLDGTQPATTTEVQSKLLQLQESDNMEQIPKADTVPPSLNSPTPASAPSSRRSSASSSKLSSMYSSGELQSEESDPTKLPDPVSIRSPKPQGHVNAAIKIPRGVSGINSKLETVQEGDNSFSPPDKPNVLPNSPLPPTTKASEDQRAITPLKSPNPTDVSKYTSENSQQPLRQETSNSLGQKHSQSSLLPNKQRAKIEGDVNKMTVETETVSLVPGASTIRGDVPGSVRPKPSHDVVRSKKDKRKASKKPTSIISGTGSSKADIFEAKVASEMEGESSDSDETFVYESNPPEHRSRMKRHHSRTPSITSQHSLADRRTGPRSSVSLHDNTRPVRAKRSMKFASNSYASSGVDSDLDTEIGTTPRASTQRPAVSGEMQSKHFGLFGRANDRSSNQLDNASPFSQASKNRLIDGSAHSSRNLSPKESSNFSFTPSSKRGARRYELDGVGSDNEQTPLIGSIRQPRSRQSHLSQSSGLRYMEYAHEPRRHWCGRWGGCFVLVIALLLVVTAASGLFYATTTPLYEIKVLEMQHVLASEQELMLDLLIQAVNPNILSISVSDLDVNVFAKSIYVGSDRFWRHPYDMHSKERRRQIVRKDESVFNATSLSSEDSRQDFLPSEPNGGIDEGTDPIDEDPDRDGQTMLLGRIFHFDSSLTFDAQPWRQHLQKSSGEIRLQRPGNRTEEGGTERWERVVSHPFQLIVRGVLKYNLPLSNRYMTYSIGASRMVHPQETGTKRLALHGSAD